MFWKRKKSSGLEPRPRLPDGLRIYAIGDVHGRADLLGVALNKIDSHLKRQPSRRPLHVMLGDYVDRGPGSAEVLDSLIFRSRFHEMVFIRGNHEAIFLEFLRQPSVFRHWRALGGLETLVSYGIKPPMIEDESSEVEMAMLLGGLMPPRHVEFLEATRTSFTCGDFFFAHAGIRPTVPISRQSDEDLMWIRQEFLEHEGPLEKFVVHGHTPVVQPDLRANRINIDTGAYASGILSVIAIEGEKIDFV